MAEGNPRGVVAMLSNIVCQMEEASRKQYSQIRTEDDEVDWRQEMESAFEELLRLLKDEHTMSAYELHSSGLVQALFCCLNVSQYIYLGSSFVAFICPSLLNSKDSLI